MSGLLLGRVSASLGSWLGCVTGSLLPRRMGDVPTISIRYVLYTANRI